MELVLYYGTNDPGMKKHEMMMKSVLVRMGVKIRNVKPEQVMETVGCLAGVQGFEAHERISGTARRSPLPSQYSRPDPTAPFSGPFLYTYGRTGSETPYADKHG